MARPKKEGMDYFPHDTDAVNDEKIEALRMLYDNDGYAFYFILLERIYRSKDGELDVSDAETIQILSKKVAVSTEKFSKMLETSFKWGCFEREDYEERGVLTSNGVKKRMAPVLEKRNKMRAQYKEDVSDAETPQKPDKGKERKEKESKESNTDVLDLFNHYISKEIIKHNKITSSIRSSINTRLKDYTKDDLMKAIDNYATVYHGQEYWFTHKYPLADFMRDKDVRKFLDEADPLNNFKRGATPKKASKNNIAWEDL